MKRLLSLILALALASSAFGVYDEDEAITWADFWHVRWITSSMNYVYAATTAGIIKYDKIRRQWEMPLTGVRGIDSRDVYRVYVDEFDKRLIANTGDGLFEYDKHLNRWYPIDKVPDLGSRNAHLEAPSVMYAPSGFTYSNTGTLNDPFGRNWPLSDVLNDRAGNLWLGFWGYGTATADEASQIIKLLPYGLLQERTNAMTMRDGVLWVSGADVGSQRTGITAFDIEANEFDYIESGLSPSFPIVDVNCLASDSAGVWAGTEDGVYRVGVDSRRIEVRYGREAGLPNENVLSLAVRNDSVWVGTSFGLALMSVSGDSVGIAIPQALQQRIVFDLVLTDDQLWIATSDGAYRLQLADGDFQRLSDPEGMVAGDVYDIEATEHHLWLAGPDGVLRLDRESGDRQTFPMLSTYRDLHAVAANDTVVAVASGQGLTLIYHSTDYRDQRRFTTADGLPSNRIFSLLMDGEYLWLGSDRGLTRFWWANPDRID
jgi:ligand-binding sensor domain-containing protein